MASARRTGVNEQISTYGNGTRDYTSLAAWEADTDNLLAVLLQSERLDCYDDAVYDDSVEVAGATTSASYFRRICPAAEQGHDGTPNTGVRFSVTSGIRVIDANEAYFSAQDLVAELNTNSGSAVFVFRLNTNADNADFVGCISSAAVNAGAGSEQGFYLVNCDNAALVDCLSLAADTRGFLHTASGNTNVIYNCTAVGNVTGFQTTAGTLMAKNCLADANSTDFTGTFDAASVTNASSDATAPGTGSRTSQTFTFVDAGSDDYHLDASDTGAKGFGTDLSGDGTFAFDDDMDGELWAVPWSIGMDHPAAALPSADWGTALMVRRRRSF